jgi:hypothetical protein
MPHTPNINSLADLDALLNLGNNQTPISASTIAAAGKETVEAQTQLAKEVVTQRNEVNKAAEDFAALGQQLEEQFGKAAEAQKSTAELQAANAVQAAGINQNAVANYNSQVNSTTANSNFQTAIKRNQDAQTELASSEQSSTEGGILDKIVHAFRRGGLQRDVLSSQQQVRNIQSNRIQATQNFTTVMAANVATVAQMSAREIASLAQRDQVATIHANFIKQKRQIAAQDIDVMANQIGVTRSTMQALNNKLEAMGKTNQLYEGALRAEYQRAITEDYLEKQTIIKSQMESSKAYETSREADLEKFFSNHLGRNDLVGKIKWTELIKDKTNPMLARFMEWDANINTLSNSPVTSITTKQKQGIELTAAESNTYNAARQFLLRRNQSTREQLLKGTTLPSDSQLRQVQKEMLDINNPEDHAQIDTEFREYMRTLNTDATPALQDGVLQVPEMKAVFDDPILGEEIKKYIPADVLALLKEDKWKDIQFSLNSRDPAGSVDASVDAIIGLIVDLKGTAESDAILLKRLGTGISGYYKMMRQKNANTLGFTNLTQLSVRGIKSHLPDLGGSIQDLSRDTINLENGGHWNTLLSRALRVRKLSPAGISPATRTLLTRTF